MGLFRLRMRSSVSRLHAAISAATDRGACCPSSKKWNGVLRIPKDGFSPANIHAVKRLPDRGTINARYLCYYRHERILMDIAEFIEIILEGRHDALRQEQALLHMESQFHPGNVVAMARKTYEEWSRFSCPA